LGFCTLAGCSGGQSPPPAASPTAPAPSKPPSPPADAPPSPNFAPSPQPVVVSPEPEPEPQPQPPEPPPPSCPGKADAFPSATGATLDVAAGGDLQAALDAAHPGDEIVLAAGAVFSGAFHLPNKAGAAWITVRTGALDRLPAAGTRVTPGALLPKIVGQIRTDPGAHHWRLLGLEVSGAPDTVVALGSPLETDATRVPHDLVLDRLYIHGDVKAGVWRAVALHSAATTIINCWISDAKSTTMEAQAIAGWNGPGPFTIVNNHIEGAAQNLLFGGGDPAIQNLVPSDIVIRWNHFVKPLTWKPTDPSYAGTHWWVKNLLELKSARRVTIDGNLFENAWEDKQSGEVALFTVRNQNGGAPWATVEDVTFTNNVARHTGGGISILGHDDNHPSQAAHDFTIANNLFYDVGGATWGGWGRFLFVNSGTTSPGPANVHADHNTVVQAGNVIVSGSPGTVVNHPGFVFTNNLTMNGPDGVIGDSIAAGDATLAAYFIGAVFTGNALVAGSGFSAHPGNRFPATLTEAGLPDPAAARLSSGSPLRSAGSDGKDIGVDAALLDAAAACRTP
jgi:hypothetical protein